jgi:hypothetical protein
MNDPLVQILVAVLPSIVVFLTAFYLIKQFTADRSAERGTDLRKEDRKQLLPCGFRRMSASPCSPSGSNRVPCCCAFTRGTCPHACSMRSWWPPCARNMITM